MRTGGTSSPSRSSHDCAITHHSLFIDTQSLWTPSELCKTTKQGTLCHTLIQRSYPRHEIDPPRRWPRRFCTLRHRRSRSAGSYVLDPSHSQIVFSYDHLGYSTTTGMFSGFEGNISFDQEDPAASSVEVSFPVTSILTGWADRDTHFQSPDFFNAAEHAEVTFKSTGIEVTGEKTAKITGDLTMNGVTKPVVLDAEMTQIGEHPMAKKNRGLASRRPPRSSARNITSACSHPTLATRSISRSRSKQPKPNKVYQPVTSLARRRFLRRVLRCMATRRSPIAANPRRKRPPRRAAFQSGRCREAYASSSASTAFCRSSFETSLSVTFAPSAMKSITLSSKIGARSCCCICAFFCTNSKKARSWPGY